MARFIGNFGGDFVPGTRKIKLNSYIVFQSDKYIWRTIYCSVQNKLVKIWRLKEETPNWRSGGWSDEWSVARSRLVDGASIPRVGMLFVGSPFDEGRRLSSAIHDVMCEDKEFPHELVHGLFTEMILFEGNGSRRAKMMAWAVRNFGPEWEIER